MGCAAPFDHLDRFLFFVTGVIWLLVARYMVRFLAAALGRYRRTSVVHANMGSRSGAREDPWGRCASIATCRSCRPVC